MERKAGFTLLEAMVVMAIVAIVATLGLPAFNGALQRVRTATALSMLTASLASARSAALLRHQAVSVCPSQDQLACRYDLVWEEGWIVFVDAHKTGQPSSPADILRVGDPLSRSLILRTTPGRHRARFQPDGRSTGSTLTLSLCTKDGHHPLGQVILNNWGRPRSVRDPAQDPTCAKAK
ncbi:GspH/FimT family pseudopilin [Luteimonas sp. SX5]|uniref:Type II secretion system protein H n=1 Tax=Luteimonas galliterrae TaxID=2940486 RepID=A0ABT0MJR5_9GAMM|nr:GspH/FimT family pseudopilin [Luteimonas galliterrae]MCL1635109.1 GspH/FimT family pseudopilin [Luteimonas galliterrae]